jgi:hypothetical protein
LTKTNAALQKIQEKKNQQASIQATKSHQFWILLSEPQHKGKLTSTASWDAKDYNDKNERMAIGSSRVLVLSTSELENDSPFLSLHDAYFLR